MQTGKKTGKRYDDQLKSKVVQEILDGKKTTKLASLEYGIVQATISRWIRESRITTKEVKQSKDFDKTELVQAKKAIKELVRYVKKLEKFILSNMLKETPTNILSDRLEQEVEMLTDKDNGK